jgi:hypothetical protein
MVLAVVRSATDPHQPLTTRAALRRAMGDRAGDLGPSLSSVPGERGGGVFT